MTDIEVQARLMNEIVQAVEARVIGDPQRLGREELRALRRVVRSTLGAFHEEARERGVRYMVSHAPTSA